VHSSKILGATPTSVPNGCDRTYVLNADKTYC
jgi:hypothetical protein